MNTAEILSNYLGALHDHDRRRARDVVRRALELTDVSSVLVDVVSRAQIMVGERWERGEASVAEEHAASALAEEALSVVAEAVEPTGAKGSVVIGCVEDEYHALPVRVMALLLVHDGWDVITAGASVPNEVLRGFVADRKPVAAALSCTMPMNLPSAALAIDAVHSVGIPVLMGGRGFGNSGRWADVLGADAFAARVSEADDVLTRWSTAPPALGRSAVRTHEHGELKTVEHELVDAAVARLPDIFPPTATVAERQNARTRQDFAHILRFTGAAVLVNDSALLDEFLAWLSKVLRHAGVAEEALPLSLGVLGDVLPSHLVAAHGMLRDAAEKLVR